MPESMIINGISVDVPIEVETADCVSPRDAIQKWYDAQVKAAPAPASPPASSSSKSSPSPSAPIPAAAPTSDAPKGGQ